MKQQNHSTGLGRALSSLVLGLTLAFSFAAPASAQTDEHPKIEVLKKRWAEKSEEEKAVLLERFKRLEGLPSEDRELFLDRAKRLGNEKRRWLGKNRDGNFQHELERRLRHRDRFPRRLVDKLERSPRERRPVLLERHLRGLRKNRDLTERFGRRLEMDEKELAELRNLSERERIHRVLKLRRRLEEKGLDPSHHNLKELRKLSDEGFFERLREIRSNKKDRREEKREGQGPKRREDV